MQPPFSVGGFNMKLFDFLNGVDNHAIFKKGERNKCSYEFVKMKTEYSNVYSVYMFTNYSKKLVKDCKIELVGLYNKNHNELYTYDYNTSYMFKQGLIETFFECNEVTIIKYERYIEDYKNYVTKNLINKIDQSNFEIKDELFLNEYIHREALSYSVPSFINDTDYNWQDFILSKLSIDGMDEFMLDYVINKNDCVENVTKELLIKYEDLIINYIHIFELMNKLRKDMSTNKLDLERKKFYNSIPDNVKTINIEIDKNGKSLACKVENNFLTPYDMINHRISEWRIVSKDAKKYRSAFGRADIDIDDISKVTYGKKILYVRS